MEVKDNATNDEIDSSCYIVENQSEVIEINETCDDLEAANGSQEEPAGEELAIENETMGDYQVIDETGCTSNQDDSATENGHTNSNSEDPNESQEDCAPKTPKPIKSQSNNNEDHRVLIDIKFRNKKTYFALHEEFIDVVKKYYRSKLDDMDIIDDAANHRVSVSEKIVKKSESFLIDTTPVAMNENELTPRYTSLNTPVLSNIKKTIDESFIGMSSGSKCFNCDKDTHSLRDCPEPRNMGKIRRARNDFNRRELRYHDDEDQFSSLVPGALSDELKQALGLSGNEIPLHVYKMRLYGYPPGWFEDAKVQHSGLFLFTGKENEENDEVKTFKYDVQKIHDFPGFNVHPEGQFVDRHRFYNVPAMLPQHSKEYFIQSLGENIVNGYKKRKLRESQGESTFCDNTEMEIASDDEEVIPLGRTIYQNQEPSPPGEENDDRPPPPESPEPAEDDELSSSSSTELEAKRQRLMDEIASTDQISKNCIDENSENENRDNSSKDITVGHVATTVFGTPVLDTFSGFDELPAGNNFMVGVSDVIAFENLAESTGKYENMRELIKKVRVFQKKHQQE